MKTIKKAIFPVAGLGTRLLPATKAMPKELLPIIAKPLIQYAAEEAIEAGCDTLVFVTGRNKRAIEDHFDSNLELESALNEKGKITEAEMVRNILPKHVQCVFVRQPKQLGLGHAVLCAERVVGDEPFLVLLADDYIINSGIGTSSNLVNAYNNSGKTQLSVVNVDGPEISKYGVVSTGVDDKSVNALIEKPIYEKAPSNIASIGRYVLTPDIFDILRKQSPGFGSEIQLSEAINRLASTKRVEMVFLNGKRYDCGTVNGYIDAILETASIKSK